MARTTVGEVKAKLLSNYDCENNPSLSTFIQSANIMTNRMVICAANKDVTFTSDELLEIETLLACHFYQDSDKGYSQRTTSDASATFHGKTEMGLESSHYGQSALMLDHSGCLRAISKGNFAGVTWGGKAPSEQVDYVDRS